MMNAAMDIYIQLKINLNPADQWYGCTDRKYNCKKSIRTNSSLAGSHQSFQKIVK